MPVQKNFFLEVRTYCTSVLFPVLSWWQYSPSVLCPPTPRVFRVFSLSMLGISPWHHLMSLLSCPVCSWFCSAIHSTFTLRPVPVLALGHCPPCLPGYMLFYSLCSSEGPLDECWGFWFYFLILLTIFYTFCLLVHFCYSEKIPWLSLST